MRHTHPPIVTLTTDFGTLDPYVAEMKGRLLSRCPEARIVDISHEVPAFAVDIAAYVLERAAPAFPEGTIHVAVIDPGVGGKRRGLVLETDRATFIAPDNGVLEPFIDQGTARALAAEDVTDGSVSRTFHGRDLFIPAAARLVAGDDVGDFSRPITDPVRRLVSTGGARVVHIDRFGNAVTSIREANLAGRPAVEVAGHRVDTWVGTYSEAPADRPVLLIGSSGRLEIAVREDSAARHLGLEPGLPVRLVDHKEKA